MALGLVATLASVGRSLIFYLVSGGILLVLVVLNMRLRKKRELEMTHAQQELERFVRHAIKEEHLESNIKKVLLDEGWPEKRVNLTIDKVRGEGKAKFLGVTIPWKFRTEEEKISDEVQKLLSKERKDKKEVDKIVEEAIRVRKREDEFVHLLEKKSREKVVGRDVVKVLLMMDTLLEKLPEDELDKFTQSDNFETFKKVMDQAKKQNSSKLVTGKTTLKELMALSEKGVITKEEARQIVGMPKDLANKDDFEKKKEKQIEEINQRITQLHGEEEKLADVQKKIEEEERILEKRQKNLDDREKNLASRSAGKGAEKEVVREIVHDEHITDEMKETLLIVDNLLGKLPHEDIEEFANSSDYVKYAKIMKEVAGKEAKKPLSPPRLEAVVARSSSDETQERERQAKKAEEEKAKAKSGPVDENQAELDRIKAAIKAKLKQK